MDLIEYGGEKYPKFQSTGFASKFAFPYALEVCKGTGLDVGCGKGEWALPGAMPIDVSFNDGYHATNLPDGKFDYIFSSHCAEHLPNWVDALDYWTSKLKVGGVLFLYLPDYSQHYWRVWNNRKHIHTFSPQMIADYMKDRGYTNIFKSGVDLNHSFMVMGEKYLDNGFTPDSLKRRI